MRYVDTEKKCECFDAHGEECIGLPETHDFFKPLPEGKKVVWHGIGEPPTIEDLTLEELEAIEAARLEDENEIDPGVYEGE